MASNHRLRGVLRLSQPLNALLPLIPAGPISSRIRPWGLTLQGFAPSTMSYVLSHAAALLRLGQRPPFQGLLHRREPVFRGTPLGGDPEPDPFVGFAPPGFAATRCVFRKENRLLRAWESELILHPRDCHRETQYGAEASYQPSWGLLPCQHLNSVVWLSDWAYFLPALARTVTSRLRGPHHCYQTGRSSLR